MEAKDVTNLPWKQVTDWSGLCASFSSGGKWYVTKGDVKAFVEGAYRDVARQLNIPYERLNPILVAENEPFNSSYNQLFRGLITGAYATNDPNLIKLKGMLRIPDVSKVENDVATDNVSACLKMFEGLSNIEKMLFLEKIGKISVNIEHHALQAEDVAVD